jgi:putative glutamine amidotransferase
MRVAILIGRDPEPRFSVHRGYVDAVLAVGATPILVPVSAEHGIARAREIAALGDALLVTGGGDVDPELYSEVAVPQVGGVDRGRDLGEMACVEDARARGVRILGICRGTQLLNVAYGGSLIQDLPSAGFPGHSDEDRWNQPVHDIEAKPDSLAAVALNGATHVNSLHHQAVKVVGAGLTATAWSADGVIEAVEADGVLGVQWHPERLFAVDERHLAPFQWLVAA